MLKIWPKLKLKKINLCAYGGLTPNSLLGTSRDEVSVLGLQATTLKYPLIKIHVSKKSFSPVRVMPPPGTWFACSMGITPCINSHVFTRQNYEELCVLTHIIPQVYLYEREAGRQHLEIPPPFPNHRARWANPILVTVLTGLGIAGWAAIGASALITGDIKFKTLSKQIDQDLHDLGQSITNLESSLHSLAEMVLQNRRGLDLLFLKQGGLCVALGETCCFYTNHSGEIKNSITLVRKI
jgi:hypothetical protein